MQAFKVMLCHSSVYGICCGGWLCAVISTAFMLDPKEVDGGSPALSYG
jgi:hypothetical protein